MSLSTPPICPKCGVELPPQKINMCSEIARVARSRPDLTYREIGTMYSVSSRTVKRYARRAGLKRRAGKMAR